MRIEKLSQRITRISCSDKDKRTTISDTEKTKGAASRFLDYALQKLAENTIERVKKEKGQKE